jgi:uncharacterized membrane protein YphA (DoxX/SURF4 family)
MGIIFRARGINSLGLFIVRFVTGAYFVGLGMIHLGNAEGYINKIKSYDVFSDNASFIIGFAEPICLIIFGALFLIGFFTTPSSLVLALITFGKLIIIGFMPSPGSIPFSYNVIVLGNTLAILFAGAGMISFDALIDRKKKAVKQETVTKTTPPPPPPPPPPPEINRENISDAKIIEEKKTEIKKEEKKDIDTDKESAP